MKKIRFGEMPRGTLYSLLLDAYSGERRLTNKFSHEWEKFDEFIYDNLEFTDGTGFITMEGERPIGFISWDPRMLPEHVELGHNCIINELKGKGLGSHQLEEALVMIKELGPKRIIVRTGKSRFFEPARRMYEKAGFIKKRIIHLRGGIVPVAFEYEMML